MSQKQSNFDFNAFNNLTNQRPAGLQVYLAMQLLDNALRSLEKFNNPRETEARDALNAVKALRNMLKVDAEKRASTMYEPVQGNYYHPVQ